MPHWAAERTIDLIRNSEPGKPFFRLVSVFDPHNPYDGYPREIGKLVDAGRIPDPVGIDCDLATKPYAVRYQRDNSYLGPFRNFSPEDPRKMRFGYYASVALAGLEIGRVLAALEEKGIAGNTLGDHRLFVKGAFSYDAGVLRLPRRRNGALGPAKTKHRLGVGVH